MFYLLHSNTVIDWSFSASWLNSSANSYQFNLKISIDFIYADFCSQLSNYVKEQKDILNIIEHDKAIKALKKKIFELENAIKSEKQFNRKVELNLQLNQARKQLNSYNESNKNL